MGLLSIYWSYFTDHVLGQLFFSGFANCFIIFGFIFMGLLFDDYQGKYKFTNFFCCINHLEERKNQDYNSEV